MIKYNYPHFTDKEIEAQIICPEGNTQRQELNTGCLAPRSTVFTKMLYHLPSETQRSSCNFVSGGTCVCVCVCKSGRLCVCVCVKVVGEFHWRKMLSPNKQKPLPVVGCWIRNKHQASAGYRKAQAARAPSGSLFYFTKFPACPLGPFTESK